ncbi:MAG: hypothetical protein HYX71_01995 [Opitutae bacterium]|nr:hypothetical protein [Opitutae bacterium]
MNTDPLDDLLMGYAKQPAPPPPDRLTAGIWHEIELRRDQTYWRRVVPSLDWHELFREPRVAVAALALALLVGLLPAVTMPSYGQGGIARKSLYFEVFSPNQPATALWTGPHSVRKSP